MKLVFFEVEEWEDQQIKDAFSGEEVQLTTEVLNAQTLEKYKDAEVVSTFIYSRLSKEILSQMPNLKLIATRSTGFDHIDMAYCHEKNIVVSNVPAYGVHTVAEHAFALILALTKKLLPSVERTKRGDFSIEGLEGIDLSGKTLGVIGAGKIGTSVMNIAVGFGMHVLAYTRHPQTSENPNIEYITDLPTLLGRSDIVTLHLPLSPETKHFINMQNITQFKKGSYLINTARGGLVETEAILQGLEQGILAGAGLDVLENECDIREERELLSTKFLESCDLKTQLMEHILLDRDDVIITPHNAFHTIEAVQDILSTSLKNVKGFLSGSPENVVENNL
ncbi:MAG TPA: NAD(P)-dependent oxidoreductase [Patescibacteria group bacterium]